jgi:NDP-sugar pyrophosphorylase family protein
MRNPVMSTSQQYEPIPAVKDLLLFVTRGDAQLTALGRGRPPVLLPLLDRPFLQQVIEYAASQGIQTLRLVIAQGRQPIEDLVRDGRRWGISVVYERANEPRYPYRIPQGLLTSIGLTERVLLGHASCLPAYTARECSWRPSEGPVLLSKNSEDDRAERWTGWAVIPAGFLSQFDGIRSEHELLQRLRSPEAGEAHWVTVPSVVNVRTPRALLASSHAMLSNRFCPALRGGQEESPGVWLSRRARIHPLARIVAPVCIGEYVTIRKQAVIGPDAVIGARSIVGQRTTVQRSIVLPDTYIGTDLEVADSLVARDRLLNARLNALTVIQDPELLAHLGRSIDNRTPW